MPITRNALLAFFAQLSMIVLVVPLLVGGEDRTRAAAPEALQRIKRLINALAERQVAQNDAVEGSEELLPTRPPEAKPHHSELSVNDPDKYFQGDVELSESQVQILEDDILSQLQPTDTLDATTKRRRRRKVGKEPLYKRWDKKRPVSYGFAATVPETTRQKTVPTLIVWNFSTVVDVPASLGISIATPGCDIVGIISHEVAHALGLFHEQARPDQQHNIAVHWNNIPVSRWNNFQPVSRLLASLTLHPFLVTDRQSDTFELPYDAGSVMHYAAYGFAVDPYRPTISTIDRNLQTTIGQRAGPSFLDVEAINTAYGCKQRCPKISCMHGGYANPNECERCLCPIGFTGSRCEELRYSSCGAQIIASTDPVVLTSPEFPEYFPKNVSCYWLIKAPSGGNVYLEFTESFHYECEDTCDKSFVEVNVGRDFRSTGYRFCCSSIPADAYRSHANEILLMHFAWGERSSGFKAKVWSNKNFPMTTEKETVKKPMPEVVTPTTSPRSTSTIPRTTTARVIRPKATKKPSRLPVASTSSSMLSSITTISSTTPTPGTTTSATTTTDPELITLIGPAACNCGLWSEWQGPCNQQCGGCGKRSRRRVCQQENCQKEEKRTCNFNACPSGTNFLFNNGEFHVLWKGCCIGLFRADDVCSGLDSNQNTFLKIFTSLLSAMDHGNSTTAAEDIPAGNDVVVDPTNVLIVTKQSLHCYSCARLLHKGSRRCSECDSAQFCKSCYDDFVPLHRLECGLEEKIASVAMKHGNPGDALRLRMALRMLAGFDADELHTSLHQETNVQKDASVQFDNRSMYAFISLECAAESEVNLSAIADFVHLVLPRLQHLKPLKSTLTDEEAEKFWTKALRAALLRIPHNGYTIVPQENLSDNSLAPHSSYFPTWRLHEQMLYGVGLILESDTAIYGMEAPDEERSSAAVGIGMFYIATIANHSCRPNLSHSIINGSTMVFRTSRDVTAGEELCDSYGPSLGIHTAEERKKFLRETYNFDCQCEACSSSDASSLDRTLVGSKCLRCGELASSENVGVCHKCTDAKEVTSDRAVRDASEVNAFINSTDWSRYDGSDMYRLFQLAQRYLECGHLLLEQAAHMTSYELILDLSMDKCEEVVEYICKSVKRRLGDRSLQYASAMNAVGALCYARLQLQQCNPTAEKMNAAMSNADALYRLHLGPDNYWSTRIKWLLKEE